jgi:hypothetical protein
MRFFAANSEFPVEFGGPIDDRPDSSEIKSNPQYGEDQQSEMRRHPKPIDDPGN